MNGKLSVKKDEHLGITTMKETEVKILKIVEGPDGLADVEVEVSRTFRKWFIEKENLDRWDIEIFKERFIETLLEEFKKIDKEEIENNASVAQKDRAQDS